MLKSSTGIFPEIPDYILGLERGWYRKELIEYMGKFNWEPAKVLWCMRFFPIDFTHAVEYDLHHAELPLEHREQFSTWKKFNRSQLYQYNGEAFTLKQWATLTGLSLRTLIGRLDMGWTVERTLTQEKGIRGSVGRPAKPGSLCDRVIKLEARVQELEARLRSKS
jgi:hypothetical protein